MKKEKIEEIITELKLEKNKWLDLYEIDAIIDVTGRGVYPDLQHTRFLIDDNCNILVKHGYSEPYGARLSQLYEFSFDGYDIRFSPVDLVPGTAYYSSFRLPQVGDIIRMTNRDTTLGEALIKRVVNASNCISMSLDRPFDVKKRGLLSFYDPLQYNKDLCIHGFPVPGIYLKFKENSGKTHKKYGVFHEIIKPKDIAEIRLKVTAKTSFKTYTIRG